MSGVGLHGVVVPAVRRACRVLLALLDKAEAHYAGRGQDSAAMLDLRLAPDMNPLAFQVESVVRNGRGAVARLTGRTPPEVTALGGLGDLRRALHETLAELDTVSAQAFDGAETREIVLPSPKGARRFTGLDYALSLALPNVYFHTSVAYALLRGAGLDIGKRDFLGELPPRDPI